MREDCGLVEHPCDSCRGASICCQIHWNIYPSVICIWPYNPLPCSVIVCLTLFVFKAALTHTRESVKMTTFASHTHNRASENDDICLTHTQESQWKWRHLPFRLSSHLLYSLICVEDRCCHNIIDGLCTFKTREYRLPRYFMIINCQDNGWEDLRYFILKFAATSFILTHLMLFNARSYATSSLLPGQLLPGHLLTGHLLTGHLLPLHLSPGHLLSEDLLPTPYLQLH